MAFADTLNKIETTTDQLTPVLAAIVPQVAAIGPLAHMMLELLKQIGGVDVGPFEQEIARLDAAIAQSKTLTDQWKQIAAQQPLPARQPDITSK